MSESRCGDLLCVCEMDEFKGQGAEMADGRAEEEGLEEVIYKQKRVAFLKVEEIAED